MNYGEKCIPLPFQKMTLEFEVNEKCLKTIVFAWNQHHAQLICMFVGPVHVLIHTEPVFKHCKELILLGKKVLLYRALFKSTILCF